ncbi:MAG: Dihydrofolate reductase [Lacunisphaera sp.]|nr:Dihydrofolate reductase [Lacunisphaera sp.]
MRKLIVFNSVTLDGYFTDTQGDMSWAHVNQDKEWTDFVSGNAQGDSAMVFGRVTYQMMAGWWPSPQAKQAMPVVADRMNSASKVVFSKTLDRADWNNTKLVKDDPAATVRKMKQESGPNLIIFGSGTIVAQLTEAGLIDEFQMIVVPVVLGKGRTLFDGVTRRPKLKLTKSRAFTNGNVFLCYQPAT